MARPLKLSLSGQMDIVFMVFQVRHLFDFGDFSCGSKGQKLSNGC